MHRRTRTRAVCFVMTTMVALGWLAPGSPIAQPTAQAASPQIDLGAVALNGKVQASVVDPVTGVTYIGGDFSQIGDRTGSVAFVEPPDAGGGDRRGSPEVVGAVEAVFADDRAQDPGLIVIGRLTAINGVKVAESPAFRLHRMSGLWVVDATWNVSGQCHTGNAGFPSDMRWIATPEYLVGGGFAGPAAAGTSNTGITLIRRTTGAMTTLGASNCASSPVLPAIPALPGLAVCQGTSPCYAKVGDLAYDPPSHRLIVSYSYAAKHGLSADTWDGLGAYDLTPTTGRRLWLKDVQSGTPPGDPAHRGWVSAVGVIGDAFLVEGRFPLDADITNESAYSRLLFVDAATGAVRQRWNALGEQTLADGSYRNAAGPCFTGVLTPTSPIGAAPALATAWIDGTLCRFSIGDGALVASASVTQPYPEGVLLPSVYYAAPGGHAYLLGSAAAVDLDTSSVTTWDPAPGVTTRSAPPGVAVVDGSVVIGGDFTFLRGTSAPGVVALGPNLARMPGFSSPLQPPRPNDGIEALALTQGRLLVGGQFLMSDAGAGIVALDAVTGAPDGWTPDPSAPIIIDDIEVLPDGGFWIAGFAGPAAPGSSLQRYGPLNDGGALIASPEMGCLAVPMINGASEPVCAPEWQGRTRVRSILPDESGALYVGGVFGTIDGAPRRGLARIAADGTVAAWDPDLYGLLPIPPDGALSRMATDSMIIVGGRLIVGGLWEYLYPNPNGGFFTGFISPLLVFSTSTGALELPSTPDRAAWFETPDWFPWAHDMVRTDNGLYVALGDQGMAVFDATTLALDTTASAEFLSPSWWSRDGRNGFYTLATPTNGAATAGYATRSSTQAAAPAKVVIGGLLPRWKLRLAGNVVRTAIPTDTTPPTATGPVPKPRPGAGLPGSDLAMRVTWSGADPHGSGIERYELSMSTAGHAWVPVGVQSQPGRSMTLKRGVTYRFRVRPTDEAGNVGSWAYGPTVSLSLVQQTSTKAHFSRGWATAANPAYSGGSTRKRSVAGAWATYTFSGRGIGLVSSMSLGRGRFKVYFDGKYVTTVDLRSVPTRNRIIVWQKAWSSVGTHTIKVVVAGTAGRPRVDVDAFVVVK